jgi:hypothetical protein
MTPTNAFVSERFRLEAERRNRLEAFDKFVDLALDGVITMYRSHKPAFTEEYGDDLKAAPD